jgi:hypothetical protein
MLALAIFCTVMTAVILIINIKMLKLNMNYVKQYNDDNPRRLLERAKASEIQDDISNYALNKGLQCIIMPDSNNNTTLFTRDKENNLMSVCIIPITNKKSGTDEYNHLLQEVSNKINSFIEIHKDILDVKN